MKKLFFCGLVMTSLFSFGQTNVTDVETMISYYTCLTSDGSGHKGFIINEDIIDTPQEIYDAVANEQAPSGWGFSVTKGPRTYDTVTLNNGQQGRRKTCWNTQESWCMIEWVSR